MMTEQELERLFLSRLEAKGLAGFLDKSSQFLDISSWGDSFFVEIVLTDARYLEDAQKIAAQVKDDLSAKHIAIEYIVRAVWRVLPDTVEREIAAPLRQGFGLLFHAQLRSGKRETAVSIFVTMEALDIVAERFDFKRRSSTGWAPDKGDVYEKTIRDIIVRFLEEQLSHGGESYWEPIKHPELTLSGPAVSYLLGHSAALMELIEAVDDALDPIAASAFFQSLTTHPVKLEEFDRLLPDLSNFLGGHYLRGQAFSVPAPELYSNLKPAERELLKRHYFKKLEDLRARVPALEQQYPRLFK